MAIPYSYDLRVKVIQFIETGNSVQEAKRIFGVSRKAIYEWKILKENFRFAQERNSRSLCT